jgi:DNA-binding NarL/FixJ family response regulator
MIRVLCVDDHPLVREAVARKIELQPDMEVVAVASTGEEAVDLFREHRPDITLMDLRLPGMTGLETIRAIRQINHDAQVVVLTMYEGDEDIHRALKAGAATYLLKSTLSDDLVKVVRAVHSGAPSLPAEVATKLAMRLGSPSLTNREIQVVELMAKGMRNKEIGSRLGISDDTVEAHTRNIFAKLKVHDRTAAVTVALTRGIIHL